MIQLNIKNSISYSLFQTIKIAKREKHNNIVVCIIWKSVSILSASILKFNRISQWHTIIFHINGISIDPLFGRTFLANWLEVFFVGFGNHIVIWLNIGFECRFLVELAVENPSFYKFLILTVNFEVCNCQVMKQ